MVVLKCDSRFLVKWSFLSTFHVTSPLRGNNDFVSWFSLQERRISQSLPMTMYSSDPLLHFWNALLNILDYKAATQKLSHAGFLRIYIYHKTSFSEITIMTLSIFCYYIKGKVFWFLGPLTFVQIVQTFSVIWNSNLKIPMYLTGEI